jgi:FMN phosphatase YigB (HAD superfamily)
LVATRGEAVTWAVTLDFHNTIAQCDEWFDLEVYDLIPAYFAWSEKTLGVPTDASQIAAGKAHYLKLRRRVIDTGIELDAEAAVLEVLDFLGLPAPSNSISDALEDIFRPTVRSASPMPGVIAASRRLNDAGIKLAVISSAAYHPFLNWTLEKFEIAGCFQNVLTSASTGHYKSSTRIYETALDVLGIGATQCIHVGDSERFDVIPARSIGMKTVLIGDSCQGQADLHLRSLVDLPDALVETFGLPLAI